MILEKHQTMAGLDMEHITEMLTCFKNPMDVSPWFTASASGFIRKVGSENSRIT
jgi:hypothetical protein